MLIFNRKDKQDGWPFQESYLSCVPILRIWNIQIRGQYENCDVIKEFARTLRFEVSTYEKVLADACSFLLDFL